jgi:hypothetical protein
MTDITYRDFEISHAPPPGYAPDSDWQWVHKDYDGPEDNRAGHAESLEACKTAVDDWWEDHFDCHCSAPVPEDCMALVCKWRKPK